ALRFELEFWNGEVKVTDERDSIYVMPFGSEINDEKGLPFSLNVIDNNKQPSNTITGKYQIVLKPFKQTVLDLSKLLSIQNTDKKSQILELTVKGESPEKLEAILNTVIAKFNLDGVLDRQEVFKRTLSFIDERFLYLSFELDSIEGGKESFKRINNLSYIEADAGISLERKSATEDDVANMETQISLSTLLKKSVIGQAAFELLPVDVGLENTGLNSLVGKYNELVLQRNKLSESVGAQHPSLMALSTQLEGAKVNIIKTINIYQTQLRTSLRRLNQEQSKVNTVFSRLPEKEKMLRSIERQQSIKENLFLLLLQKREEAAINLAVTAPSVKVVDYGLTNSKPIAPKKIMVLGIAGVFGLLLPFAFFYLKFALNNKIEERSDILDFGDSIPFLGEIPHLKGDKKFNDLNDRSMLAESFRILATNVNYMIPRNKAINGKVIFVTSAVKSEGKSLIAYNLSIAYHSMNKKVLLVGADLRNPELHNFLGMGLKTKGLTDYLLNPSSDWNDYVYPGLDNSLDHRICLSGDIPPNAPQLLSGKAFENFISMTKEVYDVIIVDTAPTIPVTDTLLIADYADVTLFVARAGVTDKAVLQEANELNRRGKLKNMAFVLNDTQMVAKDAYSYSYKEK
ncbi:MAG: polysaccharide biosynthesis tyrosine autokinase, partial [Maribacter arcticus]|uniref:GumC family protein n=1 Tax=Maribacter arcticus TaxID=561365 RepID=UPI0030032495